MKINTLPKTAIENSIASIANKILNSCYSLSTLEKRIIFLVLGRMDSREEVDCSKWYSMSVEDYALLTGVTKKSAYELLKEEHKRLYDRSITLKGLTTPKSIRHFRWIQAIEFFPDTHEIKLRWSEDLKPFLCMFKSGGYTKLYVSDIVKLDGMYASRLYDFIYQHKFRGLLGIAETTVEEIITRWEVPESCRPYKVLKSKILLPAIAELHKKHLVYIELREKQKRNIKDIEFTYQFLDATGWSAYEKIQEENKRLKLIVKERKVAADSGITEIVVG